MQKIERYHTLRALSRFHTAIAAAIEVIEHKPLEECIEYLEFIRRELSDSSVHQTGSWIGYSSVWVYEGDKSA